MQKKISLSKRGINKIKRWINPEKQFYVDLFINNEDWNTKSPNHEELLRWEIIKKFIVKCSTFYKEFEKEKVTILDIGCGRGWLSNLLSEFGKVKGIEPVGEVAKYAKTMFPEIDIISGTTKTILNSHAHSFDIIVCSEVIEHIPDSKKNDFVNDLTYLLKKDGFLIITTPRKDAEEEWKKYQDPGQPVEEWMYETDVENLFKNAEFKKVSLDRFSIQPATNAPHVEVYQLWLFQHIGTN